MASISTVLTWYKCARTSDAEQWPKASPQGRANSELRSVAPPRAQAWRGALKIIFPILFLPVLTQGQIPDKVDVESLLEPPKLSLSGNLNGLMAFNHINGIAARQDPFTWNVNAGINLAFGPLNAPLSIQLADKNLVYNLPAYQFVGISPSYKWATLHLGDRSIDFSPYTLSNQFFRGVGLELQPGKFRFSGFYGRLRNAVPQFLNARQTLDPSYKRMAWGIKTGYDDGQNRAIFSLMKASDDPNSIPDPSPETGIHPQDNLALGFQGRKTLGKSMAISLDYGLSALNLESRSPESPQYTSFLYRMAGLFKPKTSATYHNAIKAGFELKMDIVNLQLNYERISRNYQSLGVLYMVNDRESYYLSAARNFTKQRINVSANIGYERYGLHPESLDKSSRIIGSVQASWAISEQWLLALNYSNFRNTNTLRAFRGPDDFTDSILVAQVNNQASVMLTYLHGKDKTSMLSFFGSYQNFNAVQASRTLEAQSSSMFNAHLNYSRYWKSLGLRLNTGMLATTGAIPASSTFVALSPSVSLAKELAAKKLNLSVNFNYTTYLNATSRLGNVFNTHGQATWNISKKQKLNLATGVIARQGTAVTNRFTEFFLRTQYQLNF